MYRFSHIWHLFTHWGGQAKTKSHCCCGRKRTTAVSRPPGLPPWLPPELKNKDDTRFKTGSNNTWKWDSLNSLVQPTLESQCCVSCKRRRGAGDEISSGVEVYLAHSSKAFWGDQSISLDKTSATPTWHTREGCLFFCTQRSHRSTSPQRQRATRALGCRRQGGHRPWKSRSSCSPASPMPGQGIPDTAFSPRPWWAYCTCWWSPERFWCCGNCSSKDCQTGRIQETRETWRNFFLMNKPYGWTSITTKKPDTIENKHPILCNPDLSMIGSRVCRSSSVSLLPRRSSKRAPRFINQEVSRPSRDLSKLLDRSRRVRFS